MKKILLSLLILGMAGWVFAVAPSTGWDVTPSEATEWVVPTDPPKNAKKTESSTTSKKCDPANCDPSNCTPNPKCCKKPCKPAKCTGKAKANS